MTPVIIFTVISSGFQYLSVAAGVGEWDAALSANDSLVMDATTAFLVMATATCTPCLFSGPDVAMEVSQSGVSSLGISRPLPKM